MTDELKLPSHIELCCESVDMRKGQMGLLGVLEQLGKELQSDVLYLFSNKNRNLIKAIFWDRTGYIVLNKKLNGGRFQIPHRDGIFEIEENKLRLILDAQRLFLF